MPQHRPNELVPGDMGEPLEKIRGGSERVARRFLPACPVAMAIRLDSHDARRALSRRQLARLLEPRRVVS